MDQNIGRDSVMKAWVQGINAITLFVEDVQAAKLFYRKVFHMEEIFEDRDSTVFKFGDLLVNLLYSRAADELIHPAKVGNSMDGSHFVITIRVDDVDKKCAELAKLGVGLLNGPMDRPWGPRTASFMDPGGYIWEIAH